MTKPDLFLLAFLLGAVLGGFLIAWLTWAYLHTKIVDLETRLISHINALETSILSKVHLVRAQAPVSSAPSEAAGSAAPQPLSSSAAPGTPAHSG